MENFKFSDILVLFSSKVQGFSYTVGGCAGPLEDEIHSFTSQTGGTSEAPTFQIKKFNGELTGMTQRDLNGSDPEKKVYVQFTGVGGAEYTDEPGTSEFLQICWAEAGHEDTPLDSGWAGTLAIALVRAGSQFSDLNLRAKKALETGSDRSAGRLIFACEPFAKEVMRRLYGLTKTKAFYYHLESSIGMNVPIVTSAEGEKFFNVTYQTRETAATPSATKRDCVKALIYVEDGVVSGGSCIDVRVDNVISTSELAALNVQFANAAGIPANSNDWINTIDDFVNRMDAYRQGIASSPPGGALHSEPIPGGGIFKINIVPQTSVSAGSVFAVRAAFSIGTNENDSLTVKFEGFTLEFSPNAFFAEREMIKQLRARYREAMENYQRELQAYLDQVTAPGGGADGPIVPPQQSPPPTETLPPPDAIVVPPAGQAPSRESVPERPAAPGSVDVNPPAPVTDPASGGTTRFNPGSGARITDGTVSDAVNRGD